MQVPLLLLAQTHRHPYRRDMQAGFVEVVKLLRRRSTAEILELLRKNEHDHARFLAQGGLACDPSRDFENMMFLIYRDILEERFRDQRTAQPIFDRWLELELEFERTHELSHGKHVS